MQLSNTDPVNSQTRFLEPQPGRLVLDAIDAYKISTPTPINFNGPVWCLHAVRVKVADQRADVYVGCAVQGILLRKVIIDSGQDTFTRVGWFISNIGEEAKFPVGLPQDVFIQ